MYLAALIALDKKEGALLRLNRTKMGSTDFGTGKGAFGEVHVVQKVDTGSIYAVKTSKKEILKRDQVRLLCPLFTLYVMQCADLSFHSPSVHC